MGVARRQVSWQRGSTFQGGDWGVRCPPEDLLQDHLLWSWEATQRDLGKESAMSVIPRFFVRVPDRQSITAFTPQTVAADVVTASLRTAVVEVPGATVLPADYVAHVEHCGDHNSYVFGTGGMLRFSAPQPLHVLKAAADAVARALVADHFGLYNSPEVDPA